MQLLKKFALVFFAGIILLIVQSELSDSSGGKLNEKTLDAAFKWFNRNFDSTYGGFSNKGPKFPVSHNLSFLLGYWKRTGDKKALDMVELTLDRIDRGGIHDHVGGGFHRYSTDRKWLVPHFEKTLRDQSLLARTYLEAYQATKKEKYADAARDILDYVLRDMTSPQGGFYSSEDAEENFYIWTKKEIDSILGKDAALFEKYYGVTANGNFSEKKDGKNVLYVPVPMPEFLKKTGADRAELVRVLKEGRKKLFEKRKKRVRPTLDDKILTSWNGMMISSLAFGGRVLDEPKYTKAAEKAADFVLSKLYKDGALYKQYHNGRAAAPAALGDHAFLSLGLLDLYETDFDLKWFKSSRKITDTMIVKFWDAKRGGFRFSSETNKKPIGDTKDACDGAAPSGNSIAALVLLKMTMFTMNDEYENKARGIFSDLSSSVSARPQEFTSLLIALGLEIGPSMEIVVAGETGDPAALDMIRLVNSEFIPNKITVFYPVDRPGEIEKLIPLTEFKELKDGLATAFVCRDFTCKFPTNDIMQLREFLVPSGK